MRPSSSPSDAPFGALFGDPAVDAELTGAALVRAMLDVEAALARAQAAEGIVPAPAAEAIAAACAAGDHDPGSLARRARASASPVVPLVHDLTAAVPEHARAWVHHGATSQDVLDTAFGLVAARALVPLLGRLDAAAGAAAMLADRHRADPMTARTLGQHASVTTFGLVAAGWLHGMDVAGGALRDARDGLAVQLGGAVGTLAVLGGSGTAVRHRLADLLGLALTPLPWHTDRQPFLALACALARVAAALGTVAADVTLLAGTDIGEVREGGGPGRGGSSAMPHKRNPAGAVLVTASARRVPGLAATLLACGVQEHQRAAGAWQAEWQTLPELLSAVGGASAGTAALLGDLEVDTARMAATVRESGGLLLTESVAARLAPALGRSGAHEAVARCARDAAARGVALRTALLDDAAVTGAVPATDVDAALDATRWLGSADAFVDAALRHHHDRTGTTGTEAP